MWQKVEWQAMQSGGKSIARMTDCHQKRSFENCMAYSVDINSFAVRAFSCCSID